MNSHFLLSDKWSDVNSEYGQFSNLQIRESKIVFQMNNPSLENPESQKNNSQKNECQEIDQSIEFVYNFEQMLDLLQSYQKVSSQLQDLQKQSLSLIHSQQQQVPVKLQKEINSHLYDPKNTNNYAKNMSSPEIQKGFTEIQFGNNNQCNNLGLRQCQDLSTFSTLDTVQNISSAIHPQQKNQNIDQFKEDNSNNLLRNINQLLSDKQNLNDLTTLSACIKEIQFLCEKQIKISIYQMKEKEGANIEEEKQNNESKLDNQEVLDQAQILKQREEEQKQQQQMEETSKIKLKEENEEKEKQRILNSQCGLCLDCINSFSHQNAAPEFYQSNIFQYFKAKCGHYISKVCLANEFKRVFNDSIIKSKQDYIDQLQKKSKNHQHFMCNQCNHILEFDEVEKENKEYLTHARSKRKTFDCLICMVDYDLEEEGISLYDCDHIFCIGCLTSYIVQCINQNKFRYEDFKCPQDGCNHLINNYIIDRLINTTENQMLFNRMIRMQLIHSTYKNEKIALCPGFQIRNKQTNKCDNVDQETITLLRLGIPPQLPDDVELIGCTTFFSYNEKKVTEYQCPNCKYKSCLKGCEDNHFKGSKRGKNCSEFQKWKKQNSQIDVDIMAIFDKNTMCQCPKCKAVIIRNGGCNHITCTMPNCGYEFCFKCQKKWLCWSHLHYF